MSAGSATALTARPKAGDARRIGVMFMVGSGCFVVASLPGASTVTRVGVGVTYFVGSIFFTSAALEQMRTARGEGIETWAVLVQFAGTLFFNLSTFAAMSDELSAGKADLLVWSPDAFGSACFLVSSALAEIAALHAAPMVRRSALLNLVGSIAFGVSAVASYVIPDTDELLNASLATSTTLLGGLCFFWAARILIKPPPWLREPVEPDPWRTGVV